MVKTETDETLEGIESRIIKYDVDGNAQKGLGEFLDDSTRLKKEMGVNSIDYWKNTHKALKGISERLIKLANRIGQLY